MVRDYTNPQLVILKNINNNISVLLVKRRDSLVWSIPGGRRTESEPLKHAAIREAAEETGYTIKIVKKIGYYTLPRIKNMGRVFVFQGEIVNGKATVNDEICEIKWFSVSRLPSTLLPYNKDKIKDVVRGKINVNVAQSYSNKDIFFHYIFHPIILLKMLYFYFFIKKDK